jgi:[ribosomal protein S5]-alanine N-acetyltransferase
MPARSLVLLRAPRARDCAEFLARVAASRALHAPFVQPPASRRAFSAYLARSSQSDFSAHFVCRCEDDAIVGVFNLSQIFLGPFRSAYLGYYAFAPFAGRGYMTQGLRLTLRYAFGELRLHRVEANLQPNNVASRALVQRCGFTQEGYSPRYLKIGGRWRDHERWALIKEDWPKKTGPRNTGKTAGA